MNFRDVEIGVLRAFAPFDDERSTDQFQGIGESRKVSFDIAGQFRPRSSQGFIEHYEHFVLLLVLGVGQHFLEHWIGRIKHAAREINAMPIADLNGALNKVH